MLIIETTYNDEEDDDDNDDDDDDYDTFQELHCLSHVKLPNILIIKLVTHSLNITHHV